MKEQILSHISAACPFRDTLHWYDTVDSTNTLAKKMAAEGAPHGTVLIADQQTVGRGRMGRSFHSPAGCGIYFSVILRPDCPPEQLMHLTCAAGVAACDAIAQVTGLRPGIKWINDLVSRGKKLGGILTELSVDTATGTVKYAVVGIGINCGHTEADFPSELSEVATSLRLLTGCVPDRAQLCAALTEAMHRMSCGLLTEQSATMAQYRRDCITVGQQVRLLRLEESRYAVALEINDDGSLLVEFPDGSRESVSSGEASIRGMWGYT